MLKSEVKNCKNGRRFRRMEDGETKQLTCLYSVHRNHVCFRILSISSPVHHQVLSTLSSAGTDDHRTVCGEPRVNECPHI